MKLIIHENKTVYQCPYCKKIYLIKGRAENHLPKCLQNPSNKVMCFMCKYFEGEPRQSWSWKCKNYKKRIGNTSTSKTTLIYRKSGVVCKGFKRC